jgi:hypothetical protein
MKMALENVVEPMKEINVEPEVVEEYRQILEDAMLLFRGAFLLDENVCLYNLIGYVTQDELQRERVSEMIRRAGKWKIPLRDPPILSLIQTGVEDGPRGFRSGMGLMRYAVKQADLLIASLRQSGDWFHGKSKGEAPIIRIRDGKVDTSPEARTLATKEGGPDPDEIRYPTDEIHHPIWGDFC